MDTTLMENKTPHYMIRPQAIKQIHKQQINKNQQTSSANKAVNQQNNEKKKNRSECEALFQ